MSQVFSQSLNVSEVPELKDVPLSVLVQQEKPRQRKEKNRSVDLCKLSCGGRLNPVPRCSNDKGGGCLQSRCSKGSHGPKFLLLGLKLHSLTGPGSFACFVP